MYRPELVVLDKIVILHRESVVEICTQVDELGLDFQPTPEVEALTTAGSLRISVSEMARFGMEDEDSGELAQRMRDVKVGGTDVKNKVASFRNRFVDSK